MTDSPERVLHVLAEIGRSGAESMLLASGSMFRESGYESDILSTGATAGPMAEGFVSAGFGVHHVPFSKSPSFFLDAYRLMRRGRYAVIHLHTERANFWFGLVALAARPRKVVRTIHSVFRFEGRLRWRRALQRRLLRRLGVVHVACGPTVQTNERTRFGLRTRLAQSWYDSRIFFPASAAERSSARVALGIPGERTVLVTTATCSRVKNHAALIQALARIPAESRPLYLHVGIEETDHSERAVAEAVGVAESVRFLGPVPELRPIYAAADFFAMPSLYEGFSVAALEALAAGLPVLFADVVGLRDFGEIYTGIWYAAPTEDALAETLVAVLDESSDERRSRSVHYADLTRRIFGLEAGVGRYVDIYRGSGVEARGTVDPAAAG